MRTHRTSPSYTRGSRTAVADTTPNRWVLLADFLETLPDLGSVKEVSEAMESLLDTFGFRSYVIIEHPAFSRDLVGQVLIGRWPEGWAERYVARKYVFIDPVVRFMARSRIGFNWADAVLAFHSDPDYERMQRMMLDALKHGLEGGYAFPIHSRQGLVGNMSISGRIELSAREIRLFDCVARHTFWHLQDVADRKVGKEAGSVAPHLTQREAQILSFLSDGLTSGEIANRLKLSRHTVDWHIGSMQDKLEAKNRHHAIAIAFRLGLVS